MGWPLLEAVGAVRVYFASISRRCRRHGISERNCYNRRTSVTGSSFQNLDCRWNSSSLENGSRKTKLQTHVCPGGMNEERMTIHAWCHACGLKRFPPMFIGNGRFSSFPELIVTWKDRVSIHGMHAFRRGVSRYKGISACTVHTRQMSSTSPK